MLTVNALGDTCPIPVVKTKKAIASLNKSEKIETLVDNEIAVQNLTKMAEQSGFSVTSKKLGDSMYSVVMDVVVADVVVADVEGSGAESVNANAAGSEEIVCRPDARTSKVVVISSRTMGTGDDTLGAVLMKGFIYAISQQEELPQTMLFYNGGAFITCEGSASLDDLRSLEAMGVEILTCGTCLNHYGLAEKLSVGNVTNMYVIAEKMSGAGLIIKP